MTPTSPAKTYFYYSGAASALVLLGVLIYFNNLSLFYWLNRLGGHLPAAFWAFISFCGDALPVFLICILFVRRYPELIMTAFIAAVFGFAVTHGIKDFTNIDRPVYVLPPDTFHFTGIELTGYAFPSGHTLTAFLFAILFAHQVKHSGWTIVLFFFAGLIGISRIMVGAHWPLDIFGGALFGLLSGWISIRIERKWHWSQRIWGMRALAVLYILGAISMWNHDGGFPQLLWLAHGISVLSLIFALACLYELCRYPHRHLQRLQSRVAQEATPQ